MIDFVGDENCNRGPSHLYFSCHFAFNDVQSFLELGKASQRVLARYKQPEKALWFCYYRSLENNFLTGSVCVDLWQNKSFNSSARLLIDLANNSLSNVKENLDPPTNVTLRDAVLLPLRNNTCRKKRSCCRYLEFCNSFRSHVSIFIADAIGANFSQKV